MSMYRPDTTPCGDKKTPIVRSVLSETTLFMFCFRRPRKMR